MFKVIDLQSNQLADTENIASSEDWADGLIFYDMWGFALLENGSLILVD